MTYDEKIEWLNRYRRSFDAETPMALHLQELRAQADVVSPSLSGMPSGNGNHDKIGLLVERIAEAEDQLAARVSSTKEYKRQLLEVLAKVQSHKYQMILEYKYLNGLTLEKIAELMHYSADDIRHSHSVIVAELEITTQESME